MIAVPILITATLAFFVGLFVGAIHQDRRIARDLADISRALRRPGSLTDRMGRPM